MRTVKFAAIYVLAALFAACNNDIVIDDMVEGTPTTHARRKVGMALEPSPEPSNSTMIVSGGRGTIQQKGFKCEISWDQCTIEPYTYGKPLCRAISASYEGSDPTIIASSVQIYNNKIPEVGTFQGINQYSSVSETLLYKKHVVVYHGDIPSLEEKEFLVNITGDILFTGYYQNNSF